MTKADLLQRVEAASRPDRILDAMIAADLAGLCLHGSWHTEGPDGDRGHVCDDCGADSWGNLGKQGQRLTDPLPTFTASIDAALALVERLLPGAWCVMAKGRLTAAEPLYGCELLFNHDEQLGIASGHTQALAIVAATLRALIAKEAEHG